VAATDAAALGPFKKYAYGHDEKRKSSLYFDRDFSGWHNFGKIIKIVATRCHICILKPKCSKLDFGWGLAPDPAVGAYSTPQTP